MARGSSFWGSFWRETGKNTGKWASNKVFGSGWSTPFRHIIQKETISESELDELTDQFHAKLIDGDTSEPTDRKYLYRKATELKFDSNEISEITANLDELLLGAHQAIQDESSIDIFTTKIRSGIQRLRRFKDEETAVFYENELAKLNRSLLFKRIGRFILMIMVFGGLIFFAFFYKSPFSIF